MPLLMNHEFKLMAAQWQKMILKRTIFKFFKKDIKKQ